MNKQITESFKSNEPVNTGNPPGGGRGNDPISNNNRIVKLEKEITRLKELINNPQIDKFMEAVRTEAAHQIERWGTKHDDGKTPEDWMWLIAYLSTKATQASRYNDPDKYKHHIVTCAAACLNWHNHVTGHNTDMKPGAPEPK